MLEHRITKQDSSGVHVWNDAEFSKMRGGDMSLLQDRFNEVSRSDFIKGLPRSNSLSVD